MADVPMPILPAADWIARESIPLSLDGPGEVTDAAIDALVAAVGPSVDLLGLGEALHGGEEILLLRNRLFQRLVTHHGYSAIAVESGSTRSPLVNDYVAGRGADSYDAVAEAGFSHGFGKLDANRELVEWMRAYNADPATRVKVSFYGFDSPTEMMYADSPRGLLESLVLYLRIPDDDATSDRWTRIDRLLGPDADWEDPAVAFDPSKGIGLSASAQALRLEAENLETELRVRRPELTRTPGDADLYADACHAAKTARWLLTYHAGMAGTSPTRVADLLGLRDLMMADTLAYAVGRERGRGKVLAFAHNKHLQRSRASWQWGPTLLQWWPAGAHVAAMMGDRFAVIGSAVGTSEQNGIRPPEPGTLEATLTATGGPIRFVQSRRVRPYTNGTPPTRAGGKNPTYFPLTPQSLDDFDWLVAFDRITYNRGGPAIPQ
ncbi:MAG TPA: erythromycin esterase family protein [Humisphaera sp.]